MWGSMRSSAARAMLGGPSELPVLSLAAGRRAGADSEGWSASFAGDKACVAGGLAVRLPDCFKDVAKPRALAGSLLWRIHARTGSCLFCRGPVGICGRLACLDASPPLQLSHVFPFPFPLLFFLGGSALGGLGAGRLPDRAGLVGRRRKGLSACARAKHEQGVCFHAAVRELMECIVHGPFALQ